MPFGSTRSTDTGYAFALPDVDARKKILTATFMR
jgi:hypothetical protein